MKLHLKIWRQKDRHSPGQILDYPMTDLDPDMSFLELLDLLNEQLVQRGEPSIEFDHDCREGICGQCGLFINGRAHGPLAATSTCQLHLRSFQDGETVYVEPFRAEAFPIIRDLKVDRSAFDRIIQAGGFISTSTGNAPEANTIPIRHEQAESAF
ncbi:MAG: succinate dehydrogenase/fumarate reductase iron-sulfur subunit, partial [Bacteroidota bacterium]